jgi:hypothetical protein
MKTMRDLVRAQATPQRKQIIASQPLKANMRPATGKVNVIWYEIERSRSTPALRAISAVL